MRVPQGTENPIAEVILDAAALAAALDGLTAAIADSFTNIPDLALIGIKRRGDILARRLGVALEPRLERTVPVGSLDISLYRDDFDSLSEELTIGTSEVPFALDGRTIVLVDDVLFTGRTVRAALDELLDFGRPARIALAVLIDRGWRELPVCADFAGVTFNTARDDDVQVWLTEADGRDGVSLRHGHRERSA